MHLVANKTLYWGTLYQGFAVMLRSVNTKYFCFFTQIQLMQVKLKIKAKTTTAVLLMADRGQKSKNSMSVNSSINEYVTIYFILSLMIFRWNISEEFPDIFQIWLCMMISGGMSLYNITISSKHFRMYQDKLAHIKKHIGMLQEGSLPEFLKRTKKIELQYRERLRQNEVAKEVDVSLTL